MTGLLRLKGLAVFPVAALTAKTKPPLKNMNILNENSGLIFKNDRKDNPNQPDYKGSVNVCGKQLDIALWIKENARGKFMSAKFSEPYVKPSVDDEAIGIERKQSHYTPDTSGDVPF